MLLTVQIFLIQLRNTSCNRPQLATPNVPAVYTDNWRDAGERASHERLLGAVNLSECVIPGEYLDARLTGQSHHRFVCNAIKVVSAT